MSIARIQAYLYSFITYGQRADGHLLKICYQFYMILYQISSYLLYNLTYGQRAPVAGPLEKNPMLRGPHLHSAELVRQGADSGRPSEHGQFSRLQPGERCRSTQTNGRSTHAHCWSTPRHTAGANLGTLLEQT